MKDTPDSHRSSQSKVDVNTLFGKVAQRRLRSAGLALAAFATRVVSIKKLQQDLFAKSDSCVECGISRKAFFK